MLLDREESIKGGSEVHSKYLISLITTILIEVNCSVKNGLITVLKSIPFFELKPKKSELSEINSSWQCTWEFSDKKIYSREHSKICRLWWHLIWDFRSVNSGYHSAAEVWHFSRELSFSFWMISFPHHRFLIAPKCSTAYLAWYLSLYFCLADYPIKSYNCEYWIRFYIASKSVRFLSL